MKIKQLVFMGIATCATISIPMAGAQLADKFLANLSIEVHQQFDKSQYMRPEQDSLSPYYSTQNDDRKQKRLGLVNQVIKKQYSVDTFFKSGKEEHEFRLSALCIAALYGEMDSCQQLINLGASINAQYWHKEMKKFYPNPVHLIFMGNNKTEVIDRFFKELYKSKELINWNAQTHFTWSNNRLQPLENPLTAADLANKENMGHLIQKIKLVQQPSVPSYNVSQKNSQAVFNELKRVVDNNIEINVVKNKIFTIKQYNFTSTLLGVSAFANYQRGVVNCVFQDDPNCVTINELAPLVASVIRKGMKFARVNVIVDLLLNKGENPLVSSNLVWDDTKNMLTVGQENRTLVQIAKDNKYSAAARLIQDFINRRSTQPSSHKRKGIDTSYREVDLSRSGRSKRPEKRQRTYQS